MEERIQAAWAEVLGTNGTYIPAVRQLLRELERAENDYDALANTKVIVVRYNHRHGTDISVYQTYDDAYNAISNIMHQYWDEERVPRPIPVNVIDAIEYYQERTHEYFEIEERRIMPSPFPLENPGSGHGDPETPNAS